MDRSGGRPQPDQLKTATGGRVKAVQDWLSGRADTRVGRLALQWFRAYFEASHNSGCAVTVYSTLSVLPAALVAVALFHSSGSDTNAFAERLITHLKLNGATASLVQDTFGSASVERARGDHHGRRQRPHLGHRNRPDLPGRLRPRLAGSRSGRRPTRGCSRSSSSSSPAPSRSPWSPPRSSAMQAGSSSCPSGF